jgi:hypothetical protein
MTRTCFVCREPYGRNNDVIAAGRRAGDHDPDWDPRDGRCYGCFLALCYEIFGDPMEPRFTVNGVTYHADGTVEIPF